MDKKDIEDVALTAIVALCCPFTILLPPFNKVLKEDETEEQSEIWYNYPAKLRYNIGNREGQGNERDFIQREKG